MFDKVFNLVRASCNRSLSPVNFKSLDNIVLSANKDIYIR